LTVIIDISKKFSQ